MGTVFGAHPASHGKIAGVACHFFADGGNTQCWNSIAGSKVNRAGQVSDCSCFIAIADGHHDGHRVVVGPFVDAVGRRGGAGGRAVDMAVAAAASSQDQVGVAQIIEEARQAQSVHAFIRNRIADLDAGIAESLRILYGGSMNPGNAADLIAQPDIDGALVGGAALQADSFGRIIQFTT